MIATAVAYWVFGLNITGGPDLVVLVATVNSVPGVALGLLGSAFAATELQALQFIPVLVIPQILLSGLFLARSRMKGTLETVSNALPLTYSVDALREIAAHAGATAAMWADLGIDAGFVIAALEPAARTRTLRRRTQ